MAKRAGSRPQLKQPLTSRSMLVSTWTANASLDQGNCPNCLVVKLRDDHCSRCGFRFILVPSLPHNERAAFNRRAVSAQALRRNKEAHTTPSWI